MGKISEIGNRYGRWTVLSYAGKDKYYQKRWLCRCECGIEKVIYQNQLHNGESKSCGCYRNDVNSELYLKDEIGNRFERLLVINKAGSNARGDALWECFCDCGNCCYVHHTVISTIFNYIVT